MRWISSGFANAGPGRRTTDRQTDSVSVSVSAEDSFARQPGQASTNRNLLSHGHDQSWPCVFLFLSLLFLPRSSSFSLSLLIFLFWPFLCFSCLPPDQISSVLLESEQGVLQIIIIINLLRPDTGLLQRTYIHTMLQDGCIYYVCIMHGVFSDAYIHVPLTNRPVPYHRLLADLRLMLLVFRIFANRRSSYLVQPILLHIIPSSPVQERGRVRSEGEQRKRRILPWPFQLVYSRPESED